MKELVVVRELTGDGGEVTYVPVPCRCTLKAARVVSDLQMDATGTLVIAGGGRTLNTVTVPTGNIAAGTTLDGVPDATYKDTVLDPESTTANVRAISITDDAAFLGGAGTVTILLTLDDSVYVRQTASEA